MKFDFDWPSGFYKLTYEPKGSVEQKKKKKKKKKRKKKLIRLVK